VINVKEILLPKPFLRWAGGKKWFSKHLSDYLPERIKNYHEIFLGSASVFFSLPDNYYKEAYLSDSNEDLINAYVVIRDSYDKLIDTLKSFRNSEKFFYQIREKHYESDPIFRAARMIFLNKVGYNGIYRVNSLGKFNVPYGHRKNVDFVDQENLRIVSKKLKKITLNACDFEEACKRVKEGDLVFLDPPYTVAHEENGFIEYNQKLFSLNDQIRLASTLTKISDAGAYYILTNAKHKKIIEIYSSLEKPNILVRHSHIGGNGAKRENVKEYIFSNCKRI
jgi:DNA adenine methylase